MIPGELFLEPGTLSLNAGRETRTLKVANTGDRPIQVGSHYHFYETNAALRFERDRAGRDHDDRRWHRPRGRDQRHDLHARPLEPRADVARGRELADEPRFRGQGECESGARPARADRGRGHWPQTSRGLGLRARRYVAKYTINPAITHGIAHEVGSVEIGKLADLVLWKPAFFGAKPAMVLKGGMIAAAAMGDPNASIPTPQPVHYRPMFAAFGGALANGQSVYGLA